MAEMVVPSSVTAAMQTTAISATRRPYSAIDAPSSRRTIIRTLSIARSSFCAPSGGYRGRLGYGRDTPPLVRPVSRPGALAQRPQARIRDLQRVLRHHVRFDLAQRLAAEDAGHAEAEHHAA